MEKTESVRSQFIIELLDHSDRYRLFFLVERIVQPYFGDIEIECFVKWHFKIFPDWASSDKLKTSERMQLVFKSFGEYERASFGKYIVVDKKYQGKGLGSFLMVKLIQGAFSLSERQIKVDPIAVYTGDADIRDAFYLNRGFERQEASIDERAEWYAVVDDLRDLSADYNTNKIREVGVGELFSLLCQRQGDFVKSYNDLANEAKHNAYALEEYSRMSLWGKWRKSDRYKWAGEYRKKPLLDLTLLPPFKADG